MGGGGGGGGLRENLCSEKEPKGMGSLPKRVGEKKDKLPKILTLVGVGRSITVGSFF